MYKKAVTPILIAIATISLVACGGGEKNSPSQVLARVNSTEITVHELNFLLSKQKDPTAQAKQHALDVLIDEELLVQKARELKLDRDQAVLQEMEQAKRHILAEAADRAVSHSFKLPQLDTKQVDDFYNANPNVFANRKQYQLTVFSINKADYSKNLLDALNASKSGADTENLLKARGIKYQTKDAQPYSEQLSAAAQTKFLSMNPGDIIPQVSGSNFALLFQLKSTTDAPISRQQGDPIIRRAMQGQFQQKYQQSILDDLKSKAKIEYVQRFTQASDTPAVTKSNSNLAGGLK